MSNIHDIIERLLVSGGIWNTDGGCLDAHRYEARDLAKFTLALLAENKRLRRLAERCCFSAHEKAPGD